MADFCKQCSEELFGEDFGDLAGVVGKDSILRTICEGCGNTDVDHEGRCLGVGCLKGKEHAALHHHPVRTE